MFHDLMNGYSVVFSGVLLKSEEIKRSGSNVLWQKVETYDQLLPKQRINEGIVGASSGGNAGPMHRINMIC